MTKPSVKLKPVTQSKASFESWLSKRTDIRRLINKVSMSRVKR